MVIFTGVMASQRPLAGHRGFLSSHSSPNAPREVRARPIGGKRRRVGKKLIIVKFGGSSLSSAKRIAFAAGSVAREYSRGVLIVVIVSAVGHTTDRLLELTNGASGIVETDRDDILAMGERTSARIFAASLKSRGIQSRYFDPSEKDWPIITDDDFSNANPLLKASIRRIKRYVSPLLGDGIVPVIGGFIGRTPDGRISTLGRGGSDTTALVLAKALEADEVVLVTKAPGIMSADPSLIPRARILKKVDMRTLVGIADSGSKFVHRKALRFKDPKIDVRVISNSAGDLRASGTIISGGPLPELEVKIHNPDPVSSVTLVGNGLPKNPNLVKNVTRIVRKSLLAVSQDENSIILYLRDAPTLPLEIAKLHSTLVTSPDGIAVAVRRGLALITVRGVGLEATPGVTAKVSDALRNNDVNIFGILTIASSVLVFVDWKLRRRAAVLIQNSLEDRS